MDDIGRIALGFSRLAAQLLVVAQRVLGLLGAADQLLLHADHPNPIALVVCGCLLAGAQATESLVLSFIDRMMGPRPEAPPAAPDGGQAPVADFEAKRQRRGSRP